jgi:hypothetical protein
MFGFVAERLGPDAVVVGDLFGDHLLLKPDAVAELVALIGRPGLDLLVQVFNEQHLAQRDPPAKVGELFVAYLLACGIGWNGSRWELVAAA